MQTYGDDGKKPWWLAVGAVELHHHQEVNRKAVLRFAIRLKAGPPRTAHGYHGRVVSSVRFVLLYCMQLKRSNY